MKTFLEFRCQKAVSEAHHASSDELAHMGIDPDDPRLEEKLEQLWIQAGKDPAVAKYMASKGLVPDHRDTDRPLTRPGSMTLDTGTGKYKPKPLSLSAQRDIEGRWGNR